MKAGNWTIISILVTVAIMSAAIGWNVGDPAFAFIVYMGPWGGLLWGVLFNLVLWRKEIPPWLRSNWRKAGEKVK